MQADDVSNDPSACREILQGLGTPFEAARARGLPRQNQINQLSSMLVGSSIIANAIMEDYNVLGRREEETIRLRAEAEEIVKAAREGAEQLEKIERLLRSWSRLRLGLHPPALNSAGATALKEAEARAYKALEEADADCTKLNKAVEELKAEVQNQVAILEEVSARATEAEARARQVEEIVETILDAPENTAVVNEIKERARQAGFKASYNECVTHVNPFLRADLLMKDLGSMA
ncbi:hypothetical protein HanRHA438_Chr05g0223001 [Helianthus annuus]|uniref:Uncharacterized protein n=1 Tax=Helianthus annuus TaxID=4232 RepID=A0A9K3NM76_HELAN|nr:hypothetical protein HanXRQr2_Chr05g0213641 [Helianthus annuus]KAJ0584499.1 hypothetical protein HanHA89_Chr05g0189341 [Helianthus annuus]KAJ0918870.1 hypothetical protein HanRHA438_Chr05g0223001 [Helianthus annuus]KAJ0922666.1 hypothetical protein HanPSC8_Chr05g0206541 [Helianthus annuus]